VEARHVHIQYPACISDPVSITLETASDLTIEGPDEVCYNSIDEFTTRYISGADYTWEVIPADFGEIMKNDLNKVAVFWSQSGAATLRVSTCGVVVDKPILVHALPVFNLAGPTAACDNETVTLSSDQPLFDHRWIDENDQVVSTQFDAQLYPGSYAVEVTDQNGCMSDQIIQITSYPSPIVHLSSPYDRAFCSMLPNGIAITANTDGLDYQYVWYKDGVDLGPGGPVFSVTAFGTYHVEVTNQYSCTTASDKITYINCCDPGICSGPGGGSPGRAASCASLSSSLKNSWNSSMISSVRGIFLPDASR
jgi:hypothetical protein